MSSQIQTYTIHIDGDNFFVSCELTRFPHLRHLPVVVGRERGVAVALNATAKKLGIVRAMPVHTIQKQFPQTIILASHFELYKTFSKRIYDIAARYMDSVSLYSIDEVFCTYTTSGDVRAEMTQLQKEIQTTLGITVSIGIGSTKVLAKLATSVEKPNGCTHITETNREQILASTQVGDVWGIGAASARKLRARGVTTAKQFTELSAESLLRENKPLRQLYYELRGISLLGVTSTNKPQVSFQSTESFPKQNERTFLFSEIARHSEILGAQVLAAKAVIAGVQLYLKDSFGNYAARSFTIPNTVSSKSKSSARAQNKFHSLLDLLETYFDQIYDSSKRYSSTGVTYYTGISKAISDIQQPSLFGETDIQLAEQNEPGVTSSLEAIKASVRAKNGHSSLYIASSSQSLGRKRAVRARLAATDTYIYDLPLPYMGYAS
jgi:nucleotidyltransferase/DNA polymerase involved in DNA repair